MVAKARGTKGPKPLPRKFGAHMSIAGGCDRAVRAAQAVRFETVQLFTKNNNQWNAPPLSDEHVAAFRTALDETGIVDPVAHTSYLINLGSPDDGLWQKSIDAMTVEVERCGLLGIADLVVHPGSHMGEGEEAGLARVARALDEVDRRTAGVGVTIDLETTAGQGTNLGYRFEHLHDILHRVAHPERLGVCAGLPAMALSRQAIHCRDAGGRTMRPVEPARPGPSGWEDYASGVPRERRLSLRRATASTATLESAWGRWAWSRFDTWSTIPASGTYQ